MQVNKVDSKSKIAIIGSGEMAVILVENARKRNIETHTFSNDLSDRVVGLSDEHHNISIFEIEDIVKVCKTVGVCGVLPTTELTISVAAKVSAELGLNGMPVDVSEAITDKGYVRDKARNVRGLKQPDYYIWQIGEKLPPIERFPVVVKPTAMGGKRGVSVANTEEQLVEALKYSAKSMPKNKNKIIIETFIEGGKEYSVESLSYHGKHVVIQITEKITSGPPHCVELGHLQPATISASLRNRVDSVISELLNMTGVDNTTAHTEIKIVGNEIYLIELNARSGGDHIAYPLTELSTGYPYIQGAIDVAMDCLEMPETSDFSKDCCGIVFIAEQTKRFKPLFDNCEQYDWLYKKNQKTDELIEIVNNQAFDTNYFIFRNPNGIPAEISSLLEAIES